MRVIMRAYKLEDGTWLQIHENHTHTGRHLTIDSTDDINHATVLSYLSFTMKGDLRNAGISVDSLVPVEVTVKTTVTIKHEKEG